MYRIICLICLALSACSTTSTLTRIDGTSFEGKVTRFDQTTFSVKPVGSGEEIVLKDSEIVEIDHPGNVHFLVGSIIAGLGVAVGLATIPLFLDDDPYSELVGYLNLFSATTLVAVGTPIAIWGGLTWEEAKNGTLPEISLQPTVFDKDGFSPGLNVRLHF